MINSSDLNYEVLNEDNGNQSSLEDYLQNIEIDYNYDPFVLINHFIISDILPNYDNLVECNLFKEDEYGDPVNEYYIKFVGNLSFSEEKQIHKEILKEIKKYTEDLDFFDEFKEISIFLIR